MPDFLEDPSVLTKERLKSELLAHSVALPAGEQRKDVYVQLYRQHLTARNKAKGRDFSSDEERESTPARGRPRKATKKTDKPRPEENDDLDVTGLSNAELKEELIKYGVTPGPIIGSTRKVYEKRLLKLKEKGPEIPPTAPAVSSTAEESKQNGNTDSDQYSDNEDPEIILKLEKREPLKGRLKAQVTLGQRVEHNQTAEETPEIPEQSVKWSNRLPPKAFSQEEVELDRNTYTFSEDGVTETSWTSGPTKTELLQTVARESEPVWKRTPRKRVGAAEQPFDEAVVSGSTPIAETLMASSNRTVAHPEYETFESRQVVNKVIGNFKHTAPLLSASVLAELPRRTPKKILTNDEEIKNSIEDPETPKKMIQVKITTYVVPVKTQVVKNTATEERWFEKDVLKEMFPFEASTPTGISVSCRRPIKGAAGRPVQLSEYKMEEGFSSKYVPKYATLTNVKPQTAKKGRSVPIWMKILLFFVVVVFLFLVYQAMETNEGNPFSKFLN